MPHHSPARISRRAWSSYAIVSLVLLGLGYHYNIANTWLVARSGAQSSRGQRASGVTDFEEFDWDTTPTYKHLEYSPCYTQEGNYQCARLELPMDYWNGTTNATVRILSSRTLSTHPFMGIQIGAAALAARVLIKDREKENQSCHLGDV